MTKQNENPLVVQPVLRPRQQVEEQIRKAILTGVVKSGERLPSEAELARDFNVSRTTVREALSALVEQNLVYKVPGARGGCFVRSVSLGSLQNVLWESMQNLLTLGSIDFDEVVVLRSLLEVPAARLAATNRQDVHVAKLREVIEKERTASVDDPEVSELDAMFHGTVAEASGNRVLATFTQTLHRVTEPVHFLPLSEEMAPPAVRQHQRIARAIIDGDPDMAEQAVAEHLKYLTEIVYPEREMASRELEAEELAGRISAAP